MEYDNRYATNGKGNAALATGIIGTAGFGLSLLEGMNGLFGGNRAACVSQCNENTLATRYDLQREQELAAKDSEIALLNANTYNDQKNIEMYKYVDGRIILILNLRIDIFAKIPRLSLRQISLAYIQYACVAG